MATHVNTMHEPRVKKKIFPCDTCDIVFGESRDLSEHMNCHNKEPTVFEQTVLHKFLGVLAKQQEVIINKLEKLENAMETDLSVVRTQQEAHGVELAEALKLMNEKSKPKFENKDDNVNTNARVAAPT